MYKTLIIVDLQNDFMPSGALPVACGDEIIPLANKLQTYFKCIIATQDWHPKNHGSFAANHPGLRVGDTIELNGIPQILWPTHCVQGTLGAQIVKTLNKERINKVFTKGTDPSIDSYSAFFDNGHKKSTGLANYLIDQQVGDIYVMGLALDYCVKFTILDACQLGFRTHLIEDACRGVNLHKEDSAIAIKAMQTAGANIIQSIDLIN